MSVCKNCGCTDISTSHGEAVCSDCGAVVESSIIVSEVQFQENSAGVSTVAGQFVSYEGPRVQGRDSRQVTLQNAKMRIQNIAFQVNMASQYVDMAYKLFKLALGKGLTKGRRANYVAAACLYIVCRMERKPLMLLDFSDKLKVDVYTLGHTYLKLSSELYIVIPALDPCLYIERYAHRLEFGDKTLEVCKMANRLVSRMNRDWMVQGRRPSGICGAALLVAGRIFNFNRTIKDVIKVVRIGERTIKNRLNEFEQTPSSRLTIEEFTSINLEESMDPPCYTAGLKKAKMNELEDQERFPKMLEEVELLRDELEKEVHEITQKTPRKYKRFRADNDEILSLCSVAPSLEDLNEELAQYKHLLVDTTDLKGNSNVEEDQQERFLNIESIASPTSASATCAKDDEDNFRGGDDGVNSGGDDGVNSGGDDDDVEVDKMVTNELEDILNQNISTDENSVPSNNLLGLKETVKECMLKECENVEDNELDGELDLEGIDDAELDEMILNENEVKIKTIRWMRENADFLKGMKEKEERKARELLESSKSGKRKRKPRKTKSRIEVTTAQEAIEKILQENKLSDKINYDILMDFNIGSIKKLDESTSNKDVAPSCSEKTMEIQVTLETYPSPPEKKIKVDIGEEDVRKLETLDDDEEANDEHFCHNKEDNEHQPTYGSRFEESEEDFDYCDSD